MSKVSVSYDSSVLLTISSCQEVVLCLGAEWAALTVSGNKYVIATVENFGRNLGCDEIDNLTPWENPRGKALFQYLFTYDDTQLVGVNKILCSDIKDVLSSCLISLFVAPTPPLPPVPEIDINSLQRLIVTSAAHGLGSNGQIVLLQGNYALAQANALNTTADLVAIVRSINSFDVLSPGIHRAAGHGLPLGLWFALSPTVAGGYVQSSTLTQFQIRQNAFLTLSSDYILVDLQEADPATVYPEAFIGTLLTHGFTVGQRVSLIGGVWGPAVAGQVGFFVKAIIDVNNFVVSPVWSGNIPGLAAGVLWVVNPAIPGGIVNITTLNTSVDPITIVGFSTKANYLAGAFDYPLICCGSGGGAPDVTPPTILSAAVPIAGTTLVLTASETVIPISGITGFTVTVGGVANVVTAANRTAANTITLTLTTVVNAGQVVLYSYTAGNVTDPSTNALANIVSGAVTNNSTQGGPVETLIFSESFEGGVHTGTYDGAFNIAAQNSLLVNDVVRATEGNYYNPYTAIAASNDFQTYFARGVINGSNYTHLKQVIDIAFIHINLINLSPIIRLRQESGGSLVGLEVNVVMSVANNGFQLTYRNLGAGESLNGSDIMGVNPAPVAGNYYRITVDALINTAINSNNSVIKWKVDNLQGDTTAGTNRTVVSAFIAERTVNINSHAVIAPVGFNGHYVAGGNLTTSLPRTLPWGLWYDNYKLYSVA